MRETLDSGDTPAMNEMLDDFAYEEERFAFAAMSYEQPKGWQPGGWLLMLIKRDGTVDVVQRRMERRHARKALQLTAEMVLEETWDEKRFRWVKKVSKDNRKPTRRALSPRTRFDVLSRDGHRCTYCGRSAPDVPLQVDHIRSVKDGGSDDLSNLTTACQDCNLGKSSRSAAGRP